ncbi:hypothetical protein BRCON_0227 [Candidatus Sumerlaea chitinivorans]|uniref:Uncharacterized protein n=1 Tax=Sumerlaea chitinivorans TaxID=2250252 RepID=A0A2Z4Y1V1_SUMC1|nr:hypothetical protein BRCON_0227 [Candidatus Sumerlaea chitinivorans]
MRYPPLVPSSAFAPPAQTLPICIGHCRWCTLLAGDRP